MKVEILFLNVSSLILVTDAVKKGNRCLDKMEGWGESVECPGCFLCQDFASYVSSRDTGDLLSEKVWKKKAVEKQVVSPTSFALIFARILKTRKHRSSEIRHDWEWHWNISWECQKPWCVHILWRERSRSLVQPCRR